MPGKVKDEVTLRRIQHEASRQVSILISYHERLARTFAKRKAPAAVAQWTYNAARLANLHKALALIKGTPRR